MGYSARLDSVRTTVRTFAAKLEVEQQHRHGLEEEVLLLETQVSTRLIQLSFATCRCPQCSVV